MIERLVSALRAFVAEADGRGEPTRARAAGDYLDAYRLIVDCPQYEVGTGLRAALDDVASAAERLSADSTDVRSLGSSELRELARRALAMLGESPSVAP